jgi:hypothetical protein
MGGSKKKLLRNLYKIMKKKAGWKNLEIFLKKAVDGVKEMGHKSVSPLGTNRRRGNKRPEYRPFYCGGRNPCSLTNEE